MKKLFFTSIILVLAIVAYGGTSATVKRTIHVNQAGTLSNLISDSEKYTIEELTLTGELNGTDFRLLRDMGGTNYKGEITSGVLSFLDLSDSRIVAGGEMYLDANSIYFSTENDGRGAIGNSFHCSIEHNDTIPSAVFAGCKFKTIYLPKSVTCIEEKAFLYCCFLTDIVIPDSVTTIGNQAFSGCNSLTGVNLPESITDIGSSAFSHCRNLASIRLPDNIKQIGSHAFFYCSKLKTIDLPQKLENINVCVFSYCTSLASITIPSNVTWIRDLAFGNCSALKTLIISQNLSSIATNAFEECGKLNEINVLVTDYSAFCDNRVALAIKNKIGKSIKLIDSNGDTIKDFVIPNDVTKIGSYAFYYCSCLSSVIIPSNVTSIGYASFEGCTGLKTIEIPNSISSIDKKAFSDCSGLTSATIGTNVTHIGEDAFNYCQGLASILYTGINPPSNWIATTSTYVPNKSSYTKPIYINGASESCIKEMMSFDKEFIYSGQAPTPQWTNHIVGYNYNAEVIFPTLNTNVGFYKAIVPVTFTKGDVSFTAIIPYEYTIKQASLSVKANNSSREYGEENPVFSCSYSGFVNGENENALSTLPIASTTAIKTSDVGTYPISISGAEAANYSFKYEPGTLTITKAPLTAKVNNASRQYGADDPQFTAAYKDLKNGETVPKWTSDLKFETTATKSSDIGEYEINATGVATNYELSIVPGKLTITQAPLTIKANDASRKYFEQDPNFEYSCFGFLNNDDKQVLTKTPVFATDATQTSSVGKYKITPSGAEAKNYTMSYEQGELTITKRQLKATSHCSRYYGEDNPLLPIEYDGFVNNETEGVITTKPIATTTAQKTSSVGNYPITVSGGAATNYDFVYEQGVLTVTKATLSAKVKDATKVYGTLNPSFSIEYYGLKNGETVPAWTTAPTFQTEATKASGVGQYAIKAVNAVPVNYELEIADGTLNITPASLTIQANDATRLYYSDDPAFSYKCNGFVNGDDESVLISTPILSTSATRNSNVGTYEIRAGEASCSNYSISYINGTLNITPCILTASVGNYERLYNEENPLFEVKYDGFVGNEDESVLSAQATASTTATKTSDVGTYPITVSGGNANNYTFSYIPGVLTINKAEQTIVWEQNLAKLKVGDQIELKATASSGLTVAYTSDNPSIAEIYAVGNKYYLDCKAEGELWLVAVQNGNKNYYSSPRFRKNVVIGDASAINVNTRAIARIEKTTSGIRVIDANIGEMVYVYTTGGQLIHSVKATDHIIDIPLAKDGVYIVKVGGKTVKLGY